MSTRSILVIDDDTELCELLDTQRGLLGDISHEFRTLLTSNQEISKTLRRYSGLARISVTIGKMRMVKRFRKCK